MRVYWKPCQDVSLHSVNLLLPFFNPHIHPPQPPVFVPSSSFVFLSLQNSWPSLELLPLRCPPSVGCRASSTSRCVLLLPSTWAWRCVCGGWWLTGGRVTPTRGESALTLGETIRGNNGMDDHRGRRRGEAVADWPSPCKHTPQSSVRGVWSYVGRKAWEVTY